MRIDLTKIPRFLIEAAADGKLVLFISAGPPLVEYARHQSVLFLFAVPNGLGDHHEVEIVRKTGAVGWHI